MGIGRARRSGGGVIDPPPDHQAWWRGSGPVTSRDVSCAWRRTERVRVTADSCHRLLVLVQTARRTRREASLPVIRREGRRPTLRRSQLRRLPPFRRRRPCPPSPSQLPPRAHHSDSPIRCRRAITSTICRRFCAARRSRSSAWGDGSYILDFLARTHLHRSRFSTMTRCMCIPSSAFPALSLRNRQTQSRGAGAPITSNGMPVSNRCRGGYHAENLPRLKDFDFVFVCVDDGPSRTSDHRLAQRERISVRRLRHGFESLCCRPERICANHRDRPQGIRSKMSGTATSPIENAKDDEYRKNAQITEC